MKKIKEKFRVLARSKGGVKGELEPRKPTILVGWCLRAPRIFKVRVLGIFLSFAKVGWGRKLTKFFDHFEDQTVHLGG